MRLGNFLTSKIKKAIFKSFGNVEIYLFGSRIDDEKRGGDIDIAIKGNFTDEEFKSKKIKFFKELLLMDLDLKIDLVNFNTKDELLKKELKKAVKL